jgi:hypothetical protein
VSALQTIREESFRIARQARSQEFTQMHTAFNQRRQHVRSCERRSDRGDSVDAIGPPSPSITVSFPWRKAWKPQRSIPSFSSSSRACASARDPHPTAFHFPWRRVTQADSVSRCEGDREDAPQVAEKFRRDDCPCSTSPSRSSRARPFPARLLFADDTPLPPSSQTYCRWEDSEACQSRQVVCHNSEGASDISA